MPRRMTSLISIGLLGNVIVQPRLPGVCMMFTDDSAFSRMRAGLLA